MTFISELWKHEAKNCALVDSDSGEKISYLKFFELIEARQKDFLSDARKLVFLKLANDLDSIINLYALFASNHVPLLIDPNISENLISFLIERYQPNLLVSGLNIELVSNKPIILNDKLALLMSTSGSTGSPKLVRLSHENLIANAKSISQYFNISEQDAAITSLPLHYSFGLSILNSHLISGSKVVVTNNGLMSKEFWRDINSYNVTSLSGVPYSFEILKKLRVGMMPLPSIRYLAQAGGKLQESLIHEFYQICASKNWQLFTMYGQTEATARISYLSPDKLPEKIGSIGQSIPGGKITILDLDGSELGAGKEGEIVYSGKNVMLGYAETTNDLMLGDETGYILKTGDIGFKDKDGDIYITGRIKRFLKIFGLRVNLDQVENMLKNEGINSVCGGNDDLIKIAILQADQASEVKSLIVKRYGLNEIAIKVLIIDEIPRLPSGKIDYVKTFNELG